MRNDPVDPETLAALLDGKLSADERERVLARLAKSDDEYDDLLETTALVAELNTNPNVAPTPSPIALVRDTPTDGRRTRSWLRPALIGPLIVAASLFVAVVLRARAPRPADATLFSVIESAAGTERIPADWARTRGTSEMIAPEVLAFRLGVLFTDLDLAFAARDSVAIRAIGAQLSDLASTVTTGATTIVRIRFLASDGMSSAMSSPEDRRTLAASLRALTPKGSWFDLGAWAQAARHAAHAGRAEFFLPDGRAIEELNRVLRRVNASPSSDAAVNAAVQRLRNANASAARTPADVGAIAAVLDSTVAEAGR